MAGFFDKFLPGAQPAPQPAQQAPVAQEQAPQASAAMSQGQPVASTAPTPEAPLEQFKGLWETDATQQQAPAGLNFNIDINAVNDIASKLDFSSVIPQALQDRIAAGGADAMAASLEMQNLVARAVYTQNAVATTKLVEAAYTNAQKGLEAAIEQKFKLMGLAENTATTNPALTNPAVKPLVDMIQQQVITKYPNATSAEINAKVKDYFDQVGAAFNPDLAKKASAAANMQPGLQVQQPETDWANYLFNS